MNGFRMYVFLLVLAATACGPTYERIKVYEGPDLPDDRLAILKCRTNCFEVDGTVLVHPSLAGCHSGRPWDQSRPFYGEVTLLPGPHKIEFGYCWYALHYQPIYAHVDLEADHVYEVVWDYDMVSFWGMRYKITKYIQDLANGAILAKWSCMEVGDGGRCDTFELTNSTMK